MTLRQSAVGGTVRWRLRGMVAVGVTVLAAVVLVPVGPAVAIALSDAPGRQARPLRGPRVTRKVWVLPSPRCRRCGTRSPAGR